MTKPGRRDPALVGAVESALQQSRSAIGRFVAGPVAVSTAPLCDADPYAPWQTWPLQMTSMPQHSQP
jgi:hypothetical protein